MDRAYKSGAVASPPAATDNTSVGYPTAGNPQTGEMPTKPGPYWFHMMTEELVNVLAAAGITPDKATTNQLLTALQSMFVHVSGDVMTGGLTAAQLTSSGPLTGDTLTYTRSADKSNTDLNALTTSGFFTGNAFTNAPGGDTGYWYIIVQRYNGTNGHCLQIAHGLADTSRNQSWMRTQASGTWGAWFQVWNGQNLVPATAATANTIAQRDAAGAISVANATAAAHAVALGQFVASKAANGYLKLPGGMVIQWAVGVAQSIGGDNNATQDITFPIAFPNGVFAVMGMVNAVSLFCTTGGVTKTAATISMRNASPGATVSGTPTIFAIGY